MKLRRTKKLCYFLGATLYILHLYCCELVMLRFVHFLFLALDKGSLRLLYVI